jgi:predicted nucleotidyltransferase component of viral defense system
MMLHYQAVTPLLKSTLETLMTEPIFAPFRLVGGTNLALRFGHRISDDIDVFTDVEYRSLDYRVFEDYLKRRFPYYYCTDNSSIVGFGRGYYVGNSDEDFVKVDLMYADPFLSGPEVIDGIRMASVEDIAAMKLNVISRGGRKKDFWDLHYLLSLYSIPQMLAFHAARHPWEHNEKELLLKMVDFTTADDSPDPRCLIGKKWDDIKLDIIESVAALSPAP